MNGTLSFNAIEEWNIKAFQAIVGDEYVLINKEDRRKYDHDYTEDYHFLPSVVIIPSDVNQISAILKICNEKCFPVTVRGAGTGLSGGALPIYGGVLLSMERFNQILDIDERNFQATVEPGLITQVFQEAVAEKGLFYPPDPASKGSCFIGGNLAENSGGPKAVKYGVTNDYVLNLEVVLADGSIIWTGANVLKNATGLNLTQLLVGSEGTLGVITKAVFRLLPLPKHDILMLAPFRSAAEACEAVSAIFHLGIIPSGLEFMERDALEFAQKYISGIELDIEADIQAHLLIELDGNNLDVMSAEAELIFELLQQYDCGEILFADSQAQKDKLWKLRRSLGEAVKANSIYKEEDTVVKRAELPELLKGVKEIGKRYGFKSVCYGHAGDGNLHVNILKGEMSDEDWNGKLKEGIKEIFELCKKLGGTISGEHGIGLVQKEYMSIMFTERELDLQKAIKNTFDPNGILNPGKIWE
ncbi:MAG: FAD-binding protein [Bacteroidetes bacterium]|nr:FAD-binding protein [Bacteroidota bacterium]NOG58112.1 FAD-binding protein [Bacteroidota bacterium]